jgi:hypothetical protein
MLSTKYSIPEDWDNCMWIHGSFYCCSAVACHKGCFLQLIKHLMMLMWPVATVILPLIQSLLSADFQELAWAGRYKAKMKKHYFPTDLLICQDLLPLCGLVPDRFTLQSVRLLTPPRNENSSETCRYTIYYLLVVKWKASTPNPLKVNVVLNGSCDMLLHWIQVGHHCHHRLH